MESETPIIETHSLTRDFKHVRAVDSLDVSIQPGELFGLVGPDGAGKTTTLRLLAGLLDISEGSAMVAGYDLQSQPEEIKPRIGYMAQRFSLYSELTVMENLSFFSELYQVPPSALERRQERLLSFAGLTEFKNRRAALLSGGMKKKLALAATLIHEPEILLLDEPTTGVDPISRREFWDILTELHLQGTTIVVSTPYMDEADRCSMVGLLYQGHLVRCASPQTLRDQIEGDLIELHIDDWQIAHQVIQSLPGVQEVQTYGESLHVLVSSYKKDLRTIKKALQKNDVELHDARLATARMEEAFISMVRRMDEVQREKKES